MINNLSCNLKRAMMQWGKEWLLNVNLTSISIPKLKFSNLMAGKVSGFQLIVARIFRVICITRCKL